MKLSKEELHIVRSLVTELDERLAGKILHQNKSSSYYQWAKNKKRLTESILAKVRAEIKELHYTEVLHGVNE